MAGCHAEAVRGAKPGQLPACNLRPPLGKGAEWPWAQLPPQPCLVSFSGCYCCLFLSVAQLLLSFLLVLLHVVTSPGEKSPLPWTQVPTL